MNAPLPSFIQTPSNNEDGQNQNHHML